MTTHYGLSDGQSIKYAAFSEIPVAVVGMRIALPLLEERGRGNDSHLTRLDIHVSHY